MPGARSVRRKSLPTYDSLIFSASAISAVDTVVTVYRSTSRVARLAIQRNDGRGNWLLRCGGACSLASTAPQLRFGACAAALTCRSPHPTKGCKEDLQIA